MIPFIGSFSSTFELDVLHLLVPYFCKSHFYSRDSWCNFLENSECTLWFTTLHQLFLIPLCFFVLNRDYPGIGLRWKSFRNSLFLGVIFSSIATAFFNESCSKDMCSTLAPLDQKHSIYNLGKSHILFIIKSFPYYLSHSSSKSFPLDKSSLDLRVNLWPCSALNLNN